ncbi:MAG TPA: class I SAM-dependent methyltransferase [Bryobacteraceae bacterium]
MSVAGLLEEIVLRLSMRAHNGHPKGDLSHRPATFSVEKYDAWREESLKEQFEEFFDWRQIEGKSVLDFGCGSGALSLLCAQKGAESVIGIDLAARLIARANELPRDGLNLEFVLADRTDRIPLPDSWVDAILCFDVLEHIMDYRAIVHEWSRILTPRGRVLVWWSVWWHPYGHHQHTMIPLPWVHALLSDESMLRVCARIYDTPRFQPRIWHLDEQGQRKPNPYRGGSRFGDLNKLTIREFDRVAAAEGLRAARKQINPFTGRLTGVKKILARSPWPDFFCSSVVYELEKPPAS